jgi:sec-independent protein translocase protein TatB
MLGIGWTEMLVIGVVALIVIGPKELPAVMKRIGQFAGTIRRMGTDFQRELNKTTGLNEITNLRNSVTQPLKATAEAIRKEFNTTTAAGKVEPSGALKPADPKAESVVDEIKAKAGMAPDKPAPLPLTAAAAAAMAKGAEPKASEPVEVAAIVGTTAPVKAKRAPRVKLPADTPVVSTKLPSAKPKSTTSKAAAKKAAAEADQAPAASKRAAKPAAKSSAAAKPAVTKAAATAKPKAAKPADMAAKPRAAKPAAAAKSAEAAADSASAEPAPKPAPRTRKPATKKA